MGTVGTLLGEAGVNIEAAQISQTADAARRADGAAGRPVPVDRVGRSSRSAAAVGARRSIRRRDRPRRYHPGRLDAAAARPRQPDAPWSGSSDAIAGTPVAANYRPDGPPVADCRRRCVHEARGDPRRRDRARGGRRGASRCSARSCPASRSPDYDLGAARWHRDRRVAARLGARRAAPARRDPARRGRRPDGAERHPGARPAAAAALRARPPREPAPGPAVPGRAQPAGR